MIEKKSKLKFYKDKGLVNEIEDDTFDLGLIDAGDTKQFSFWVYNPSNAVYEDLDFIIEDSETKVLSAPKTMYPKETKELLITCTPDVTIEEPVKTQIRVKGREIWK